MQQFFITLVVSAALLGGVDGCSLHASCNGHGTVTGGSNNVNCTCHCQEGWTGHPTCLIYSGHCSEYSLSSCISGLHPQCVWTITVCQLRALEHCQSIKTQNLCDNENSNTCEWSQEWQDCNLLPNDKAPPPRPTQVPPTVKQTAKPTATIVPTPEPLMREKIPPDGSMLRTLLIIFGSIFLLAAIFLLYYTKEKWVWSRKAPEVGNRFNRHSVNLELTTLGATHGGSHNHSNEEHHENRDQYSPPVMSHEAAAPSVSPPPRGVTPPRIKWDITGERSHEAAGPSVSVPAPPGPPKKVGWDLLRKRHNHHDSGRFAAQVSNLMDMTRLADGHEPASPIDTTKAKKKKDTIQEEGWSDDDVTMTAQPPQNMLVPAKYDPDARWKNLRDSIKKPPSRAPPPPLPTFTAPKEAPPKKADELDDSLTAFMTHKADALDDSLTAFMKPTPPSWSSPMRATSGGPLKNDLSGKIEVKELSDSFLGVL